jgi:hypothetical protein
MSYSRKRRRASAGECTYIRLATKLQQELNAIFADMPFCPVEPTVLRIDVDIGSSVSDVSAQVIAPRGVLARHLEVRSLPKHARPGRPIQFDLVLSADYPCTAPAELEAAATSLVPLVYVDILLVCGQVSQPLLATLAPTVGGRSVIVSVPVPASAGRDSKVVICDISIAGQSVMHGHSLPVFFAVVTGMLAPLRLEGASGNRACAPVISANGVLFCPRFNKPDVAVFSADGTPLPFLPVAGFGMSKSTRVASFDEDTTTLLLADENVDGSSNVVATNAVSRTVHWTLRLDGVCFGIAVLFSQGLVVSCTFLPKKLQVHRLSDGAHVATEPADRPSFIATDPATAILFVSTANKVSSFRWNGGSLVPEGVIKGAGNATQWRPLTVVPPAFGLNASHLVVGTFGVSTLLILSLPDRQLVHTHVLEGVQIVGLTSDPSGTALAVCDSSSNAVHVLPWPLPGMPPLH